MAKRFEVVINQEHCKNCGVCIEFCRKGVIGVSQTRNSVGFHPVEVQKPEECIGCLRCALMCPDACIEVYGLGAVDSRQSVEEGVKP
jgi:2-oxoglutarate ferredoxin oxidoreductase subunit delta